MYLATPTTPPPPPPPTLHKICKRINSYNKYTQRNYMWHARTRHTRNTHGFVSDLYFIHTLQSRSMKVTSHYVLWCCCTYADSYSRYYIIIYFVYTFRAFGLILYLIMRYEFVFIVKYF